MGHYIKLVSKTIYFVNAIVGISKKRKIGSRKMALFRCATKTPVPDRAIHGNIKIRGKANTSVVRLCPEEGIFNTIYERHFPSFDTF